MVSEPTPAELENAVLLRLPVLPVEKYEGSDEVDREQAKQSHPRENDLETMDPQRCQEREHHPYAQQQERPHHDPVAARLACFDGLIVHSSTTVLR